MSAKEDNESKRISVDLRSDLIEGVDHLKKEWGVRSRGAVLERLLEFLLKKEDNADSEVNISAESESNQLSISEINKEEYEYSEDKAIVLTAQSSVEIREIKSSNNKTSEPITKKPQVNSTNVIDLPGFVRKKAVNLRQSLDTSKSKVNAPDTIINTVKFMDLDNALKETIKHWLSLYGNKPGEDVLEASMLWLARDIWPHVEDTDNKVFTWTAAINLMKSYCPEWQETVPTLERVIVTAGVIEDPFSSKNLSTRIPTLIRRFVNRFKKRRNVTSFQTLESTMTVHGALKILGLPTQAGSSLKLSNIREAYRSKALENHPDSGGSTETMRKLNEGYQLLKNLYRNDN